MLDIIGNLLGGPLVSESGWVNKPAGDDYWYGGRSADTDTGIPVDELTALKYATVYACVAKRAKTIATVPLMVFERLDSEGARRQARNHGLYGVLHDAPNAEMDAVSFWESRVANMDLWGAMYAEKVTGRAAGDVVGLKPMASSTVTPMRNTSGELVYEQVSPGGQKQTIPASRVLRINGLSLNGITGLSLVGYHRQAIALGLACQKFGSKFFKQGANFSGVIESGKELGDKAYERLKNSFDSIYSGVDNSHKTLLLEDGATFKSTGMPLKDAQFLELQKFTQLDICGIMDVPPHKIGILDHATFSNVEEQNIQWVVDTIAPLALRISSAINQQLLGNDAVFFAEHVLNSLLRGDILKRFQAFGMGRQWGFLCTNDILRLENMNPVKWGDDDHLRPLNMVPANSPYVSPDGNLSDAAANQLADILARRLSGESNEDNRRDTTQQTSRREVFQPVVLDACRRIVAKECKAVAAAWKKHASKGTHDTFNEWVQSFYDDQKHEAASNVLPVLLSIGAAAQYSDGAAEAIADKFASEYAAGSVDSISTAMSTSGDVSEQLESWAATKPAALTERILSQFP